MCKALKGLGPGSDLGWRVRTLYIKAHSVDPHLSHAASQLCLVQLIGLAFHSIPVIGSYERHEPLCRSCKNKLQHLMPLQDKSLRRAVALENLAREQADTPCSSASSRFGASFGHPKKMLRVLLPP